MSRHEYDYAVNGLYFPDPLSFPPLKIGMTSTILQSSGTLAVLMDKLHIVVKRSDGHYLGPVTYISKQFSLETLS